MQKRMLNVGGGSRAIPIPAHYTGWRQDWLDIDPAARPDVVMDAREMGGLAAGTYDAVYCSHNLEHYDRADGARVLKGFAHVLKADGFAEIHVPDVLAVIKQAVKERLDLDDTLYESTLGPIQVRDVIWGMSGMVEKQGNEFYAHKTGFSRQSLTHFVNQSGLVTCYTGVGDFSIALFAFKRPPTAEQRAMIVGVK